MKACLFTIALAFAIPTLVVAQAKASYQGPEIAAPVKGISSIVIHTSDSTKAAYVAVVRGLLAAGYGLDKQEALVGHVSTTPKLLPTGSGVRLIVQATVFPTSKGSDVVFRGLFTWASVLAQGTTLENQQLPAIYISGGNSPTQRAWNGLQQAAVGALPAGTVGYK